ncbi:protein argonaute-2 isoform X1 [Lates japonicus]|uniref:Protein argonaute-2 isoform X1 n=1 Tax=Lates japonicus TaxID=270547 RepID=A0AAD3NM15_LATJO|nr:protein argonaute-2 isoform X1 [Lates japonicus]
MQRKNFVAAHNLVSGPLQISSICNSSSDCSCSGSPVSGAQVRCPRSVLRPTREVVFSSSLLPHSLQGHYRLCVDSWSSPVASYSSIHRRVHPGGPPHAPIHIKGIPVEPSFFRPQRDVSNPSVVAEGVVCFLICQAFPLTMILNMMVYNIVWNSCIKLTDNQASTTSLSTTARSAPGRQDEISKLMRSASFNTDPLTFVNLESYEVSVLGDTVLGIATRSGCAGEAFKERHLRLSPASLSEDQCEAGGVSSSHRAG